MLDTDAALAPDAPILHPDAAGYRYLGSTRPPVSHPNVQGEVVVKKGLAADPAAFEALFAIPERTFVDEFRTGRQHQCALEPHGALVDAGDATIRVLTTNKGPFSLRAQMAAALELPAESIVVETGVIGGDFGGKGLSVDEYVCYLLSRVAGRPVRMISTYEEELSGYAPRHGGRLVLRSAVDATGRIVAHDADLVFDGGAYAAAKPIPELIPPGGIDVMAPYDIPNIRIRVRAVYTNTVPGGHMRCPGEVQAAFASESHVDGIVHALDLDPIEFRRRNAAREGSTSAMGQRIRGPMAVPVLERLAMARVAPSGGDRGFGVAIVARRMEGGRNTIVARPTEAGRIRLQTGLPDQGAGAYTAITRIAATTMGIDPGLVEVEHATTAEAPPDMGVGASRVTFLAGHAAARAAQRLMAELCALAAAPTGEPVELMDGAFRRAGGTMVSFSEIVRLAAARGLRVEGTFDSATELAEDEADYTFAGLAVTVSVDRETGRVQVEDALFVADTGTVINPIAHLGQIEGGFAQGLGAALMEELVLDGGQVLTANLSEYRIPATPDVPRLRVELLPDASGPGVFGAKMAGELSPSCVAPAIANAIEWASGVRVRRIPITPERLLQALKVGST